MSPFPCNFALGAYHRHLRPRSTIQAGRRNGTNGSLASASGGAMSVSRRLWRGSLPAKETPWRCGAKACTCPVLGWRRSCTRSRRTACTLERCVVLSTVAGQKMGWSMAIAQACAFACLPWPLERLPRTFVNTDRHPFREEVLGAEVARSASLIFAIVESLPESSSSPQRTLQTTPHSDYSRLRQRPRLALTISSNTADARRKYNRERCPFRFYTSASTPTFLCTEPHPTSLPP